MAAVAVKCVRHMVMKRKDAIQSPYLAGVRPKGGLYHLLCEFVNKAGVSLALGSPRT